MINTQSTKALDKLAEQSRSMRTRFEGTWYHNYAFFLGDQWCFWNKTRLDRPKLPPHIIPVTENRIMPVILTRLAKKVKQRPVWTVLPNSGSPQDIDAAELGEQVMEGMWKELCMEEKLFNVLMWADICAAGFWKITWDSTAGEKVDYLIGTDGNPIKDQMGRMVQAGTFQNMPMEGMQTKTISQGQVCIDVRSPFEILPDPLGKSLDDCEWIIEEVVQSEQYVKEHYGVELTGDTEISAGPADSNFFPSYRVGTGSSYKGVKVREMWIKPCQDYEKGRRTVWAKDKILADEDSPYEGLPYIMFKGVDVPGRFWPTSITEQLIEPQTELNKAKSQVRSNAQRLGNPALLRDRSANVRYSGVPGEEVLYDGQMGPNSVPTYLVPPGMPPYVIDEIDRIEGTIREIAGQHEVTNSTVPAGVTAASAINLLLEQDDTRLGPVITALETQLSYSGQMVLKLIAQYYTEERMIRLVGEDQNYDFLTFRGEQLRGNTQVEVQAGSQFPSSKAAKQAAIQQTLTLMIQNGQPLDPRTMRKVLRDYQVGGLEAFFMDVAKDESQTNREHRLMYSGLPLPITPVDNDEIHVANHEDEQKTNKFFRSPRDIQAIHVAHLALHKDRMAAKQAEQQQSILQQQQQMQTSQMNQEAYSTGIDYQADIGKLETQARLDAEQADRDAYYKLQQIKAQAKVRPQGGNSGNQRGIIR